MTSKWRPSHTKHDMKGHDVYGIFRLPPAVLPSVDYGIPRLLPCGVQPIGSMSMSNTSTILPALPVSRSACVPFGPGVWSRRSITYLRGNHVPSRLCRAQAVVAYDGRRMPRTANLIDKVCRSCMTWLILFYFFWRILETPHGNRQLRIVKLWSGLDR